MGIFVPSRRMPTVFTQEEVTAVLAQVHGTSHLMASLLYGAGLRLMECVRLRVKDLDFAYSQIVVRDGKGAQDRVTMLPQALVVPLQRHLIKVQALHEEDVAEGYGDVYLPYALARKYPNAGTAWVWQYVFPAAKRSGDPRSGVERRHHVSATVLQKVLKEAIQRASIAKHLSYAAPLLCDSPPGAGLRRSHRAGTPGAQGCQNHYD
jgi:integrase